MYVADYFGRSICSGEVLTFKVSRINVYDLAIKIYAFLVSWLERTSPSPRPSKKSPPLHCSYPEQQTHLLDDEKYVIILDVMN